MAESDYQRGLRGGDCQVSVSDHKRYFDWAAGRDAYQKAQDERIEALITNSMTPSELAAHYEKRNREYEIERQVDADRREKYRREEKERAYVKLESDRSFIIILAIVYFIVFLIIGYILKWFLGIFNVNISVFVILIISIAIASIPIWQSENSYKKDKEKLRKQYGDRY